MLIPANYQEVRHRMRPLDVVAFRGEGATSNVIAKWTRCTVSHVGIITTARLSDGVGADALDGTVVSVMESTSLDGFSGVIESRMSDRVRDYEGSVWWLPLSDTAREQLDLARSLDFLYRMRGRTYDFRQAVLSGLDMFDDVPGFNTYAAEDWSRVFCSELVCGGWKAGTIWEPGAGCSEQTPHEIVSANVLADDHYQISGGDVQSIGCHPGGR